MKDNNIRVLSILLSLLLVIVIIQSYFIYNIKSDLSANADSNVKKTVIQDSDFFNQFNAHSANPFKQMQKMQEEMQKSFGNFNSIFANDPFFKDAFNQMSITPLSDFKEDKNAYIVKLNIPGASEQNLEITNDGNLLKVLASANTETDKNGTNYIHKERFSQRFERSFVLPNDADMNTIKSVYKNGVLKITVQKKK